MKITSIKQQLKRDGCYSIYVDDAYAFSLSGEALLDAHIASGQELQPAELAQFKRLSADDKIYLASLRYVAMRPRTQWDLTLYLQRKMDASPALTEHILNRLSIIGLVDDKKYAEAFVRNRQLLKPSSRRKIIMELRKKRIANDIIEEVIEQNAAQEQTALQAVITSKRRQAKYQDDQKLLAYLARQGFSYDDIKRALNQDTD